MRRAGKGKVLVGFAGGGGDALALFARLEAKLEEFNGNLERAVVELPRTGAPTARCASCRR